MKEKSIRIVREKYECLEGFPNERSRRIWAAAEAESLGHGGQTTVCRATGIDYKTIRKGMDGIRNKSELPYDMIRKSGGGRKKITEKEPVILEVIENLVSSSAGGDPGSPLKRTCKSSYDIAEELKNRGFGICQKSVRTILTEELGYGMQANRKTEAGREQHPDRNSQFVHINEKVISFRKENCPVLSVT